MLHFDPASPFPLLERGEATYAEEQKHSEAVDAWLGIDATHIEASLQRPEFAGSQNFWIGLPTQALLTPYTEIRSLLHVLSPTPQALADALIVDLGAGYGRMGFVLARHYPEARFLGYEFISERVREGNRCLQLHGCTHARLVEADLADPGMTPEIADLYFLYDYGSREAIEKTLQDLRAIAATRSITVVGRGRASRDAIERQHPWLSQVRPPEHYAHFSIYRS